MPPISPIMSTYDPASVVFTFGPVIVSGFADGTFLNVENNEESYALMVGIGESCRSKTNNASARITATLLQSSAINDLLSAIHNIDINGIGGIGGIYPSLVKDLSGRSLHAAAFTWIVKPPTSSFARGVENREWVFETNYMINNVGGN